MNFSANGDAPFKRLKLKIPLNIVHKLSSCYSKHTASPWNGRSVGVIEETGAVWFQNHRKHGNTFGAYCDGVSFLTSLATICIWYIYIVVCLSMPESSGHRQCGGTKCGSEVTLVQLGWLCPECGWSKLLRNICTHLPDCKISHLRRWGWVFTFLVVAALCIVCYWIVGKVSVVPWRVLVHVSRT
jgi:hypothetical protein